MSLDLQLLIGLYATASAVAFFQHGWDKRLARANRNRISERTLLLISILGGWPGAWLGQKAFRHKTRKAIFRRRFWVAVLLNLALLGLFLQIRG